MTNFKNYDEWDALCEYLVDNDYASGDVRDALDLNELEIVEAFAYDNNLIDSAQTLSDLFDEEIAPLVVAEYGVDDEPAMNEAFNNWSDSLCKDDELHELQYSEYCYVGKYS